jgi:hypothetical protein
MARLSQIEWDIIDARVRAVVELRKLKSLSSGLLWIVLDQFFPSMQDSIYEAITDGPDDRGVDAVHIIESEETAEVYIFQSKYRETCSNTDKTINESEALKIALFLDQLFDKEDLLRSCGNFRLSQAVERIWELHEAGVLCRYRIVFCSNDQGLSTSAVNILTSICNNHQQVTYESYGYQAIIRDLSAVGRNREAGTLQVISKEIFERTDGDVRGVIASVDARSYVDLIRSNDGLSVSTVSTNGTDLRL